MSANTSGTQLKIEPARIHLASDEALSHLRWRRWGGETAFATGIDYGSLPNPGHRATNPVDVEVSAQRPCSGKLAYTSIRVYFPNGVPWSGQSRHIRFAYTCLA